MLRVSDCRRVHGVEEVSRKSFFSPAFPGHVFIKDVVGLPVQSFKVRLEDFFHDGILRVIGVYHHGLSFMRYR
jgi:hypothetical protein